MRRLAAFVLAACLLAPAGIASDRATWVITDQSAVTMTATTTGTGWLVEKYTECSVFVDVTAASGTTPTLDVAIQTGPDNSIFVAHTSFTQITGVTTAAKNVTTVAQYLRLKYTIAGSSPSFTLTSKIVCKT